MYLHRSIMQAYMNSVSAYTVPPPISTVREINSMLHTSWESDNYENLEKKFASKWVESVIIFLVGGTALNLITLFMEK